MNCIIVGNSPDILGKNKGKLIDSFDRIVRINDFETLGYEDDIGSKTHIWVTNGSKFRKPRDFSKFSDVIISSPCFDRSVPGITHYIPLNIIEYANSIFRGKFGGRIDQVPTTGLYTCIYFSELYKTVSIFGLNGLGNMSHYYDSNYYMDLSHHSRDIELKMYEYFVDLKKFIPI